MKKPISISEFKDTCLAVLSEVAKRKHAVVVTKHGKPIAKIVPVDTEAKEERPLKGSLLKGFSLQDFEVEEGWSAAR